MMYYFRPLTAVHLCYQCQMALMLDQFVIILSDFHNFLKILRGTISEPWFICINVYVSLKMGLATYFVSLSNINAV